MPTPRMNKTRRLIVTTLALTATLVASLAADASEPASTCSDSPSGELAECLGVQNAISEDELSKLYLAIETREANSPAIGRLKDAQFKWRSYRDAHCELLGLELRQYSDSKLNPLTQHCLLQMNQDRISHLKSLSFGPTQAQANRK